MAVFGGSLSAVADRGVVGGRPSGGLSAWFVAIAAVTFGIFGLVCGDRGCCIWGYSLVCGVAEPSAVACPAAAAAELVVRCPCCGSAEGIM